MIPRKISLKYFGKQNYIYISQETFEIFTLEIKIIVEKKKSELISIFYI